MPTIFSLSLALGEIVILAAVIQGLLLALFLIANREGNRKANIFLALLILLYSLDIWLEALYASPEVVNYTYLIGVNDALFFLYGPLLYLYAYFLSTPKAQVGKKWLFHFAPFLLIVIVYLPTVYLQSPEFKLATEGKLPPVLVSGWASYIDGNMRGRIELASGWHELAYIILTLVLLKRHETTLKDSFSAIEHLNLSWLKKLTYATGVIVSIDIILYFLVHLEWLAFGQAVTVISVLCAFLIYAIGYLGLRQPALFSSRAATLWAEKSGPQDAVESLAPTEISAPVAFTDDAPKTAAQPAGNDGVREKYYKSTLTAAQAESYLAQLLEVMETQQLYLEGELKLSDVAAALGISGNTLSQVINDKLQRNFYDFVNGYRVETARKLLADPQQEHLTLLAVAFASGFNSKSAFNSVFKKHCQVTPSEFKKAGGAI